LLGSVELTLHLDKGHDDTVPPFYDFLKSNSTLLNWVIYVVVCVFDSKFMINHELTLVSSQQ